jgi:acetate kinase
MTSNTSSLVLVVNSGSSSLKFKVFDAAAGLRAEVSGLVERIGDVKNSRIITANLTDPNAEKSTVNRAVKASAGLPMLTRRRACTDGMMCTSWLVLYDSSLP